MITRYRTLPDLDAVAALAGELSIALGGGVLVGLSGGLGAGKTTLVRALLREFGVTGTVRSPTYTLVEPYPLAAFTVYHLDLYRLADPEELELIGLRDLLSPESLLLVEWPERGTGVLPPLDLMITLSYAEPGRHARLQAPRAAGEACLKRLGRH